MDRTNLESELNTKILPTYTQLRYFAENQFTNTVENWLTANRFTACFRVHA